MSVKVVKKFSSDNNDPIKDVESGLGVKFASSDEINALLRESGNLTKFLEKYSELCPLLKKDIKIQENLGKGAFGEVWLVKFKGIENKYAMKVQKPFPLIDDCAPKNRTITSNITGKKSTYKDAYFCKDNKLSEYVISLLASDIKRRGVCMNFLDTFAFNYCKKDNTYIWFMELITTTFDSFKMKDIETNSSIIQILFSLYALQSEYQIYHYDLHGSNIFISEINSNTKNYEGEYLKGADWFSYTIGNDTYYFPSTSFLVIIGDFGESVKYSSPLIGNNQIFETEEYPTSPDDSLFDLASFLIPYRRKKHRTSLVNVLLEKIMGVSLKQKVLFDKAMREYFRTHKRKTKLTLFDLIDCIPKIRPNGRVVSLGKMKKV